MRLQNLRPRFSLGLLLLAVVSVGLAMGLRQGLYVPLTKRAELRRSLEEAGLTVRTEAPPPSWRGLLFSANDLLEVVEIQANEGRLPDTKLRQLWRFPRLRSVSLRGCDVTDAEMADLARIPALETLDLANTRVGDEGLARLRGRRLVDLDLMGTRVTGDSLPVLATMTDLRRLIIPARIRATDLAPLVTLTNLTALGRETHLVGNPGWIFHRHHLPESLRTLPLMTVEAVHNPFRSAKPETRSHPLRTESPLYGPPGHDVGSSDGRVTYLRFYDDEPIAWPIIEHADSIGTLAITPPITPTELQRLLQGPPIDKLSFNLTTLDQPTLAQILTHRDLQSLNVSSEHWTLTPEELIDTLSRPTGLRSLSIGGPIDWEAFPRVMDLIEGCPVETLVLGSFDTSWRLARDKGQVRFQPPPASRGVILHHLDPLKIPAVPPDWVIENWTAREEWLDLEVGWAVAPDQIDTLCQWIACPRTVGVKLWGDDWSDPRLLDAIKANPRLTSITIEAADLTDADVLALIEKPSLQRLRVSSPYLTESALAAAATSPHLSEVWLGSPQFTPEIRECYLGDSLENSWSWYDGLAPGPPEPPEEEWISEEIPVPELWIEIFGSEHDQLKPSPSGTIDPEETFLNLYCAQRMRPEVYRPLIRSYPRSSVASLAVVGEGPAGQRDAEAVLNALPEIRHLELSFYPPSHPRATMARLPRIGQLETLCVNLFRQRSLDLSERLFGEGETEPDDLTWADQARSLETLDLQHLPVSRAGLVALARAPSLACLRLDVIVGDGHSAPSPAAFLRNGAAWRKLAAPDLRLTNDDLAELARQDALESLVIDAVLIDHNAVPSIETLLMRGADLRLLRANLDFPTVARLRRLGQSHFGSFDVTIDSGSEWQLLSVTGSLPF